MVETQANRDCSNAFIVVDFVFLVFYIPQSIDLGFCRGRNFWADASSLWILDCFSRYE